MFYCIHVFIPCLNLRKTYGNLPKSTEISGNFRKLRKRFTVVFGNLNGLKNLKIFGNVHKFLQKFGDGPKWFLNVRKMLEDLRKCSENLFKSNFQKFLWFFKIFGKSSEIVGSVRKSSENFRT